MLESRAPVIWNRLNGLICVYKPADTKVPHVRHTIMTNICTGTLYETIACTFKKEVYPNIKKVTYQCHTIKIVLAEHRTENCDFVLLCLVIFCLHSYTTTIANYCACANFAAKFLHLKLLLN